MVIDPQAESFNDA